jgi:DNA-binding NarL/FixJ family response regulator
VVLLIVEGLSNKEIARQLNMSESTVKVHLHSIYRKLAINNRTTLAVLVAQQRD